MNQSIPQQQWWWSLAKALVSHRHHASPDIRQKGTDWIESSVIILVVVVVVVVYVRSRVTTFLLLSRCWRICYVLLFDKTKLIKYQQRQQQREEMNQQQRQWMAYLRSAWLVLVCPPPDANEWTLSLSLSLSTNNQTNNVRHREHSWAHRVHRRLCKEGNVKVKNYRNRRVVFGQYRTWLRWRRRCRSWPATTPSANDNGQRNDNRKTIYIAYAMLRELSWRRASLHARLPRPSYRLSLSDFAILMFRCKTEQKSKRLTLSPSSFNCYTREKNNV